MGMDFVKLHTSKRMMAIYDGNTQHKAECLQGSGGSYVRDVKLNRPLLVRYPAVMLLWEEYDRDEKRDPITVWVYYPQGSGLVLCY